MTYQPGDPGHINVHNDLRTSVANLAAATAVTVMLPPVRNLGDTGHVDDHNLYTTAIQKIADEATIPTATISSPAPTGQYTDGDGTWDYYEFTSSGSLTVDRSGLATVLVVGGGGGGSSGNGSAGGGGGGVYLCSIELTVGSHSVTVGAGGAPNGGSFNIGSLGGLSALGTFAKIGGGGGGNTASTATGTNFPGQGGGGSPGGVRVSNSVSNVNGGGAGGVVFGTNPYDGRTLNITGSAYEYAPGGYSGAPANYGRGGFGNQTGNDGVVIVRVKV